MPELLKTIGKDMPMTDAELAKLIRSAPKRYKVFEIPKRSPGQFRTIAQPAREVKLLQYWVITNILAKLPVHRSATAYRKTVGLADNARPHLHSRYLLKLDFRDFFPSIRARDFEIYMDTPSPSWDEEDVKLLCRILFWTPKGERALRLSIGAPSSPILSNILLYHFDHQVAEACERLGVTYTRYADDMSFSANESRLLQSVEEHVVNLCRASKSPHLELHEAKTVRVSMRQARRVTSLVLTNDKQLSLGREQKRRISATVHRFLKGQLSREEITRLKGMLAYIHSVEPTFLRRLEVKYGSNLLLTVR
ncbi:MAG TPA: retron St85 family RNA-directed DNA polymerase [Bryobacteraceae bacterium]|jgi:retron-type reverse transcriptase